MIIIKYKIKKDSNLNKDTIQISFHPTKKEEIKEILSFLMKLNKSIIVYNEFRDALTITIEAIYYLECVEKRVYIYTKSNVYRWYGSFSQLKILCQNYGIIQINKNTLINPYHIAHSKTLSDCRRIVSLDNGEKLIVNRKFLKDFELTIKNKTI